MAIDLTGILDHDVLISMIGNSKDWIFFYTRHPKCIQDLKDLPFNVCQQTKDSYSMLPPVDATALAERIALTWEKEGIRVSRRVLQTSGEVSLQSFVLM